jgi:hypothetical protein
MPEISISEVREQRRLLCMAFMDGESYDELQCGSGDLWNELAYREWLNDFGGEARGRI